MTHLSKSQIRELNEKLNRELTRVKDDIKEALLKSDNNQFVELAGRVHDIADESVADLLADLNYIHIDRLLEELRRIDRSRHRLLQGNVDRCEDCGQNIPFERLKAAPTATRCISCQTKHENKSTPTNM